MVYHLQQYTTKGTKKLGLYTVHIRWRHCAGERGGLGCVHVGGCGVVVPHGQVGHVGGGVAARRGHRGQGPGVEGHGEGTHADPHVEPKANYATSQTPLGNAQQMRAVSVQATC